MMNIGIIGCGRIARKMVATVKEMDNACIYAVAARSDEKAAAFAAEFGIEKHYGSYEELCKDTEVGLVYIATPMNFHKEHMLLAIENGKAVLCEKSFTINAKEAEEVFEAAKKNNVFVAEAIWTRYMPSRRIINDIIRSGKIGQITTIAANLGYKISEKERVQDPKLGGGALLDIGVYPINFALMAEEGKVLKSITGSAVKNELGCDYKDSITLTFEDGAQAVLFSDVTTNTDKKGFIYGTEGYIEVKNINNPEAIYLYSGERAPVLLEEYPIKHRITGYEYEVEEAIRAIEDGKTEADSMPYHETLRVMRIMDALRGIWDVKLGDELK